MMTAKITKRIGLDVDVELNGRPLGNFRNEQDGRRAILKVMREQHGLTPKDGDDSYIHPKEVTT